MDDAEEGCVHEEAQIQQMNVAEAWCASDDQRNESMLGDFITAC